MKLVIAAGSYERILYGVDVEIAADGTVKEIKESFAIPAHTGYIKTVSCCPRFLVSGATDETIRIFDLKKRKDVGSLTQHQGSVGALYFTGNSHLLSGGEDGRIGLFRIKDWECLHVLKHKKPVTALTIHPTGKLALSVGKGRSLKLWNLMTGKLAHTSSLPYEPLCIVFSESGRYYSVISEFNVLLYETESNKKMIDYRSENRLACATIMKDDYIFVAGEGSTVKMIEIEAFVKGRSSIFVQQTNLTPRIKGIALIGDILIAASSSGLIKGLRVESTKEMTSLFDHHADIRITCLTATIQ